jgi:hypothetical protein
MAWYCSDIRFDRNSGTPSDISMTPQIIRALTLGRTGASERWPWHVRKVEGYMSIPLVQAVLSASKSESPINCSLGSARIWKGIYCFIRAAAQCGFDSRSVERGCSYLLQSLENFKSGDPWNSNGENILWSPESASGVLARLQREGARVPLADALRLCAVLRAWTEAIAFTDHTNFRELHGPYLDKDSTRWYVHSFWQLDQSQVSNLAHTKLGFDEIIVAWPIGSAALWFELFNNDLALPDFCSDSYAYCLTTTAYSENLITHIARRVEATSLWVERQRWPDQAYLILNEWARRLEFVLGSSLTSCLSELQIQEEKPGVSLAEAAAWFNVEGVR